MHPNRRERRAAERPTQPTAPTPTEAQLAANRANAQLSTGPTTAEGKATVSQNRVTHGLAGCFRLLSWEDPDQFKSLVNDLYDEHKPVSTTEHRLVESIAQHFWLMQRAMTLQDQLLIQPELDHKTFSLYLRYQTTNERAYYKAMRELQNLRKEARREQIGFESQARQQEAHESKTRLNHARAAAAEIETEVRATMEAPLPGHARIPFADLKDAFCATLRDLNRQLEVNIEAKAEAKAA